MMSREEALVSLSEKTSYPILQENGQRRYGPPPDWVGPQPARGCEVFIGKIPRDCFEDELVPIFEKAGRIYMFRLMMDFSGCNRGYGFCIYTNREDTRRAVAELDNYEIRRGKMLGVCFSVDNCRLFVGGIPKTKTKDEIMCEMLKVTEGVRDVIVYPSVADKTKNRGFAFVEYENHKAAAMARRKLIPGRIHLWGHQIAVDWAEPEREVDEDIMSKVRILYVRNLMLHTTEEALRDHFNRAIGACDAVERVKKIRDYAFVHFRDRIQASTALRQLDGTVFEGSQIEVTWAKPVDKNDSVRISRTNSSTVNNLISRLQCGLSNQVLPSTLMQPVGITNFTNFNLMDITSSKAKLKTPMSNCYDSSALKLFNSGGSANLTPQMSPLSVGFKSVEFQPLGKTGNISGTMNGTVSKHPLHPTPHVMTPTSPAGQQFLTNITTGTGFVVPSVKVIPQKPEINSVDAQSDASAFSTPPSVESDHSHGANTRSLCLLQPPPTMDIQTQMQTSELKRSSKLNGSLDSPTGKNTARYQIQQLKNICLGKGLGLPKMVVHAHEPGSHVTGEQNTLYTAQVLIPGLHRQFVSPLVFVSPEEAIKHVAGATSQWLLSQCCIIRPTIEELSMGSVSSVQSTNCKVPELFKNPWDVSHPLLASTITTEDAQNLPQYNSLGKSSSITKWTHKMSTQYTTLDPASPSEGRQTSICNTQTLTDLVARGEGQTDIVHPQADPAAWKVQSCTLSLDPGPEMLGLATQASTTYRLQESLNDMQWRDGTSISIDAYAHPPVCVGCNGDVGRMIDEENVIKEKLGRCYCLKATLDDLDSGKVPLSLQAESSLCYDEEVDKVLTPLGVRVPLEQANENLAPHKDTTVTVKHISPGPLSSNGEKEFGLLTNELRCPGRNVSINNASNFNYQSFRQTNNALNLEQMVSRLRNLGKPVLEHTYSQQGLSDSFARMYVKLDNQDFKSNRSTESKRMSGGRCHLCLQSSSEIH